MVDSRATIDLTGTATLVTGAGSGIGAAIALLLATSGARVAVNDVDARRAQETVDAISTVGGEALAAPGDVSSLGGAASVVRALSAVKASIRWQIWRWGTPASALTSTKVVDLGIAGMNCLTRVKVV